MKIVRQIESEGDTSEARRITEQKLLPFVERLQRSAEKQGLSIPVEVFSSFAWNKFGKSPGQLLQERAAGSLDAVRQISRLADLYGRWVIGKLTLADLKFKASFAHGTIMREGLRAGAGLEHLSEGELEKFFEDFCPCGKSHSAESLKKLRANVRKKLTAATGRQRGGHSGSESARPRVGHHRIGPASF